MFLRSLFGEERTGAVSLSLESGLTRSCRETGFAVAMQATAPQTRAHLSEGRIVIWFFVCFMLVGLWEDSDIRIRQKGKGGRKERAKRAIIYIDV